MRLWNGWPWVPSQKRKMVMAARTVRHMSSEVKEMLRFEMALRGMSLKELEAVPNHLWAGVEY